MAHPENRFVNLRPLASLPFQLHSEGFNVLGGSFVARKSENTQEDLLEQKEYVQCLMFALTPRSANAAKAVVHLSNL